MLKAENYFSHDDFVPSRCHKASKQVIYTDKYLDEDKGLQQCIQRMQEIGHEEWQLLEKALGHKDGIMYMFEEASYLQGFHDVLDIVARGRLD